VIPRLLGLTLLLLVLPPAAGADVYRWVDDSGVVHYSDEPRGDAERIELPEPPTVQLPSPAPQGARTDEAEADAADEAPEYRRLAITSPGQEQTIQSAPGEVPVRIALEPRLREGHRIALLLDGEPVAQSPVDRLQLTLAPVDRGTHTLRARVVDGQDRVLARSRPVTFYLHRPSVNLPPRQGN